MKLREQMRMGKDMMRSERLVTVGTPTPEGRMVCFDGQWVNLHERVVKLMLKERERRNLPVEWDVL